MIPSHIVTTAKRDDEKLVKYLNVNLSHALWKDIQFAFLQISHDNPPAHIYLFRLLWRWQGFNALVFVYCIELVRESLERLQSASLENLLPWAKNDASRISFCYC